MQVLVRNQQNRRNFELPKQIQLNTHIQSNSFRKGKTPWIKSSENHNFFSEPIDNFSPKLSVWNTITNLDRSKIQGLWLKSKFLSLQTIELIDYNQIFWVYKRSYSLIAIKVFEFTIKNFWAQKISGFEAKLFINCGCWRK